MALALTLLISCSSSWDLRSRSLCAFGAIHYLVKIKSVVEAHIGRLAGWAVACVALQTGTSTRVSKLFTVRIVA